MSEPNLIFSKICFELFGGFEVINIFGFIKVS
jgi:hypothetical protein